MAKKRWRKRNREKKIETNGNGGWNYGYIIAGLVILLIVIGSYVYTDSSRTSPTGESRVEKSTPEVPGKYVLLSDEAGTREPEKIKIMEFISFYCGHCYQFEGMKPKLKEKYGNILEIELRPIVWGDQSIKTVEAYLLAKEFGKGEEMKDALFKANFEENRNIGDMNTLIDIAKGISLGDEFAAKLESGHIENEAMENIRSATRYEIRETPTLIIDGNIKVDPHLTDDNLALMMENLDTIIGGLLEK